MRAILPALLTLSLAACLPVCPDKHWIRIPVAQAAVPQDSREKLLVGDVVYLRARDGKQYHYTVRLVDADGFRGKNKNGYEYRVRFADLEWMEVERWGVRIACGGGLPLPIHP